MKSWINSRPRAAINEHPRKRADSMFQLITILWSQHLKRVDVWIILVLGLLMIGSMTLLLVEGQLIQELANFSPFTQLVEQSLQKNFQDPLNLIKQHVVRSGLVIFQFTSIILMFLFILGDPLEEPRTISLLISYPISRVSIFVAQIVGVMLSTLTLSIILWLPCLFNSLYAGIFLLPMVLGSLFFTIKLLVIYSLYRICREVMPRTLAGLISLIIFSLAHFDQTFAQLATELTGLWKYAAYVIEAVLPPFDKLNHSVTTAYKNSPFLFLRDVSHLIVILGIGLGVAGRLFDKRDISEVTY